MFLALRMRCRFWICVWAWLVVVACRGPFPNTHTMPPAAAATTAEPAMLIASGADQAYRAADGAADFDRQAVLVKTLSVEMDGIRTVRFLVQNHGTTPLPAGMLQVEACPSKAYTQGMASLRPLPAGEAD